MLRQFAQKMSFTHQPLCKRLFVGGLIWWELERIRGQDDLSLMNFYLITYLRGGLVLTGFRKTEVVPYPLGGLAFLQAS